MGALEAQLMEETQLASSLLATLEKLSMRRSVQDSLIRLGIVDWILKVTSGYRLTSYPSMAKFKRSESEYLYQYPHY